MTRNIDGKPTSDKKHIANALNNFFTGVVDRLLRSLGHTNRQTVPCNSRSGRLQGIPQFKFQSVSEEFTKSELKKLKTNKSCGLDAISPRLLKDSAPIVAEPLTCIINKSLATGVVPDDWKCARVTPLFKGGKRCELFINLLFYQFSNTAILVWTCCGKVSASSLEKLQRRATRIIVKSSNSEQAMSSLAFETLWLTGVINTF